jgi:hypothetical protein
MHDGILLPMMHHYFLILIEGLGSSQQILDQYEANMFCDWL